VNKAFGIVLASAIGNVAAVAAGSETMDLAAGWRFRPDPQDVGILEKWHTQAVSDADWTTLDAGSSWESQGHPELDGHAWYRKRVSIPADWQGKRAWIALGGVNDAYELYCNGKRVAARGDADSVSVHNTATSVEVGSHLRPGHENLIAIRVLDWGGSGGLWRLPCVLTVDPARLPPLVTVVPRLFGAEDRIGADVHLGKVAGLPPGGHVRATLTGPNGDRAKRVSNVELNADTDPVRLNLAMQDARPGSYEFRIEIRDAQGLLVPGGTVVEQIVWPNENRWAEPVKGMRVLNNFVTELLHVAPPDGKPAAQLAFRNPREGWVFFRLVARASGPGAIHVRLGDVSVGEANFAHRADAPRTVEAMRFLPAGSHTLDVTRTGACTLDSLIVRAVPEILYCKFQSDPHVKEYGPYDWDMLQKHVLPHVNTIVGTGAAAHRNRVEAWRRRGLRWIVECGVPGVRAEDVVSADKAYAYWTKNPGLTDPNLDGVIADEFIGAGDPRYTPKYAAWTEAVRRIHANTALRDKRFYPYCVPLYHAKAPRTFIQTVMDCGYPFALERYLKEQPTEAGAWKHLDDQLQVTLAEWRALQPECGEHMIVCLGYMSAPPESLNSNPSVDYKVYMDMQFNLIANHPAFWRLYGIMEYLSAYADEEIVRWAGRLFRHYCIEGKADMLSTDPYVLPHLVNPDFDAGTTGWTVEPAEPNGISTGHMAGYGFLEGRYPRTTEGDNFLVMRRNAARPNRIVQQIKHLQPGRLYSLKMFTGDDQDLSKRVAHAISIRIENADVRAERTIDHVFANCYSHHVAPFDNKHKAWMNYHVRVFRATGPTARLIISDWRSNSDPGGPIGQALRVNFVEVQPYFEPDS